MTPTSQIWIEDTLPIPWDSRKGGVMKAPTISLIKYHWNLGSNFPDRASFTIFVTDTRINNKLAKKTED